MKKLWKRCAAVVTALVMTAGAMGFSGLAGAEQVSAAEDSVTVYISSQEDGAFLHPYGAYEVKADLAESYGYEDDVTDGVSALDVLVRAHELAGIDVANLKLSGDFVSTCFNGTGTLSFMVDGEIPHYSDSHFDSSMGIEAYTGKSITGTRVGDGQRVEFFDYLDTDLYMDSYPYVYLSDERINNIEVPAGAKIDLNIKALWVMFYGFATEPEAYLNYLDMVSAENAQLAWVNSDGSITDIDGAVVDENGDVTITIPETASVGDELLLTEYVSKEDIVANPIIMSVITIQVTDSGEVTGTFERGEAADDDSQGGGTEKPTDPQVEEATVAVLDNALKEAQEPAFEDEWQVLALARAGAEVPEGYYRQYYDDIAKTLEKYDGKLREGGDLPTDYAKVILALTATGRDVTDVGGYDLTEIMKETYEKKGGTANQVSFALIALNAASGNKNVRMEAFEETLIDKLLSMQNEDGGFSVAGSSERDVSIGSDVDVTAMAVQALTPYRETEKVKTAVDNAVTFLTGAQKEDGGYPLVESAAQSIIALTALDMDPATATEDKSDSILDSMMTLYLGDGTFQYGSVEGANDISTEQGTCALVAYQRYLDGDTAFYDMSDVEIQYVDTGAGSQGDSSVQNDKTEQQENGTVNAVGTQTGDTFPVELLAVVLVLAALAAGTLIIVKRKSVR